MKKIKFSIIILLIVILVIFLSIYISNRVSATYIKVITPNGGEVISYGDIYMAGDLPFRWVTSEGGNYKPSPQFSASIINESNEIVREGDSYLYPDTDPTGIYSAAFPGESKIERNVKYKIVVCDLIKGNKICDTSDDYFTVE